MATAPGDVSMEESLQGSLRGTSITFLVLNTIFYAQRLYSRHLQKTKWGIEDFLMVFAYVMAQAVCADCIVSLRFGVGIHFAVVEATEPEILPSWGANSLYALPILYMVASALPKISVLILYLRILIQPWLRAGCWVTMAVVVLACVINVFTFAFQCNPVEAAWDPAIQNIYCNDINGHLTYSPISNIVTDVAMIFLPLPTVIKLNAPRSVKIGLACTFVLASLGTIASCARFAVFVIYTNDWDYTWVTAQMSIWTVVESSVYFISACLLMCRPLLTKLTAWPPVVRALRKLRSPTDTAGSGRRSSTWKSGGSPRNAPNAGIRAERQRGLSGTGWTAGSEEDELHIIESQTGRSTAEPGAEAGPDADMKLQQKYSIETGSS